MFNKLIRSFKLIMDNENGWAVMATMAVASLMSSNSQRNASMKAQVADSKLQRAKMGLARTRGKEALSTNSQRLKEAAQRREVTIESNRVQAESKIDEVFAGSGISGTSVSELDSELNAAVTKNKYANTQALDTQLSDASKAYGDQLEDINLGAANINTTAPKNDVLGNLIGAAGAAGSVAGLDSKFGATDFGKKFGL